MSAADRFYALFRGFGGAHGTYDEEEFNPSKGKQEIRKSARTLRRPVTVEIWERHLAGEYHLGVITICEDNCCWWGAVDIDSYQLDHAAIVEQLSGIPAVVCRTKSGGAHVYLFFSEAIPAAEVMPRLRELSTVLGYGGSEVFPKQPRVVTEQEGLGNWINMPYFGGDQTRCHAFRPGGLGMSVSQFLTVAEKSRISRTEFLSLQFRAVKGGWQDAPPCLEILASRGLQQGEQNSALFSFGVLARKMEPVNWPDLMRRWNSEICVPPHPPDRVEALITSISKKEYGYKCHDAPCASHCNMALCRTRRFGIGTGGGAEIIESVSILDTEPPLFYVFLKTGGKVECDGGALLSPRIFQQLVLEQLQTVIPQYRNEMWLPMVRTAVERATHIEAPSEVGTTGQLHELLEQFCTDRHAAEHRDEIILGKPWRDDETGMVWFRLKDLTTFLDRQKFQRMGRGKVTERIKDMGGRDHFFNLSGRGVNCWGVPAAALTWTNGQIRTPEQEEGPV